MMWVGSEGRVGLRGQRDRRIRCLQDKKSKDDGVIRGVGLQTT